MNDLVSWPAVGRRRIAFRRTARELKEAIERGDVLLELTHTAGGTRLGMTLDGGACAADGADYAAARGHLEGDLGLDGVPVRLHADLDIGPLVGEGYLTLRDAPAAAVRAAARAHAEAP
jgi:hypothetical protein